jgi:hypothetical protein
MLSRLKLQSFKSWADSRPVPVPIVLLGAAMGFTGKINKLTFKLDPSTAGRDSPL